MERKHNAALTSNARNLRQKVIDHYIVDFYCHEAKMNVKWKKHSIIPKGKI